MFDAYAHVGLPRFLSAEDYRALMARLGITKALVCAFDACPDLAEVHRAVAADPEAMRGLGLPLGRDAREVEAGVEAQMTAGFVGLRFSTGEVARHPEALETVGRLGGLALVVGERALADAAPALLAMLERHPAAQVVGGHFAGPTDPAALTGAVGALFDHPRFGVVFSRQGFFADDVLIPWAEALLDRLGWDRIMWGTEAPVLFWRDERIDRTPFWIDRFAPDAAQRAAFFEGTARRFIFDRAPAIRPLALPFDPMDFDAGRASPFWPFGLTLDSALGGRLVAGWLAWGGEERGPLSAYLGERLDAALPLLRRR